ncbi:enoyl-CoA hydratase-related protein [Aliikangiella coralliicola]|uniref:Enoyl-CoA hydratase n=1 Tax=Aliikangiella coralliicola TaxID=2592383 RepID=A0A545UAQ7_9GAMM|nr:enoyl-CoA hydratase-related protein [Aliikangiella coralliicola]TQV86513.1 enoyl-CoA hydratase [Aliikangiella coralliicola]
MIKPEFLSNEPVIAYKEGPVYEISINRPDKMNALTDAMYGTLIENLKIAEKDKATKVILLRSTGDHFSAGNDLADFLETDFNLESNVVQFLLTMASLTKPIIAVVNGAAVGIGTTMLLHCDLVYAAADVKFSVPFIKLGLTPEGGSSRLLAECCGARKANEWLLTGRNILADEALSSGLVNQVFDDAESCWHGAMDTAQKLAKSSSEVLVASKKLLKGDQVDSVVELIKKEALVFAERLQSDDAKAAFAAFLNR